MPNIVINNKKIHNPVLQFIVGFIGILIALFVVVFVALPIVGVALSFAFGVVVVVLAAVLLAVPLLLLILLPLKSKLKNFDFKVDIDEKDLSTTDANFHDFNVNEFDKVKVFLKSGNLNITGKEVDNLSVSLEEKDEKIEYGYEEGNLVLVFKNKEKVNVNIDSPRDTEIELFHGAGNVDYKNLTNPVDTKLGAGNIKGSALGAGTKIKLGAGNVDLTYNELLDNAKIDIKMGTGSSKISLPKEATVNAKLKSAAGKLNSAFPNMENAAFNIDMKAGAGSLDIQSL